MRRDWLTNEDQGRYLEYPHAPAHWFVPAATYFVTARTLDGNPCLAPTERRHECIEALRFASRNHGWSILAWVVLSNHYHYLCRAPESSAATLPKVVHSAHRFLSSKWNGEDGTRGRQVWYQYWDTCISSEGAFWARLNYIHHNPVRHGLVASAHEYPFSSYRELAARDDLCLAEVEPAYPWERLDLEKGR